MGEHRATHHSEKAARRHRIVAAAAELLQRWSFADITMDRIADLTGVAKGTLYLYFRTKETLFLTLYEEQLGAWYRELETLAAATEGKVQPAAAARVIASTLSARPILVRLHGLLHSAIGQNVDHDALLDFRRRQLEAMSSLASGLANRIAGLLEVDALRVLVRLEAVVGGLSWTAFPTPPLQRALTEPELEIFRIDFEEELQAIVASLLDRVAHRPNASSAGPSWRA